MADAIFADPRLAVLYDALEPDRSDLDAYVAMVGEFGARRVLDLGCGTGTLAVLLAQRGVEVIAVDPARASLDVARRKSGADMVHWIEGDAGSLPELQVDLAVMTANVAQVFVDDTSWAATLRAVAAALRPGGRLVFETRVPERRAWQGWTADRSRRHVDVPGTGGLVTWVEVTGVDGPCVSFRWTFAFDGDGAVLTSDSTLRFRGRDETERSLTAAGLVLDEVRDAPDRPGLEWVFIAHRPD